MSIPSPSLPVDTQLATGTAAPDDPGRVEWQGGWHGAVRLQFQQGSQGHTIHQ